MIVNKSYKNADIPKKRHICVFYLIPIVIHRGEFLVLIGEGIIA